LLRSAARGYCFGLYAGLRGRRKEMEIERPPFAPLTKSRQRLLNTGLILCGWALLILLRLFDLQVFAHHDYVKLGQSQQEKLERTDAARGAILDRHGHYLAISSSSQFVVVNPHRIPNKEFAGALLARILGLDAAKLQRDLEASSSSKHHRGYLIVDPHVSEEKAETLRGMKLDWLEIREGSLRSYPNGQLAVHVVGNVGADGDGAAGVELKLDNELAGKPGLTRVKIDVKQRAYAAEVEKTPVVGKNIGLTIDSELQQVAEQALKAAVIDNHAIHGSLVAMDPKTGEVLALANYPAYDPNERLHFGDPARGRQNLAVGSPFEPGSVFKVITLSAALETTNLRPGTIINCGNGTMTIFGRVVHDHKSYPSLSMEEVLAKSSNIGAIRIGMTVGSKNLYEYIRRFGFGRRTGIELPGEAPGMLRPLERWQPTSIGSVPMGHEISVTSVQLAQAGSVIANGGFLVHPHVVMWKQAPGTARESMKFPRPTKVLEPENVITMRMMMRRVMMPGGTGHALHIAGYTLAGKTGTAQIYDFAHHVYTHRYNASFLGFAPIENPAVVIVVTVTGTTGLAGYGGSAAGPAFQTVMATALRLMGIPRDVPQEIEAQELIAEKEKGKSKRKDIDDLPLAELSTPPTQEDLKEAAGDSQSDPAASQTEASNGLTVPSFIGETVKNVIQEAAENGIEVDMFGEGVAREQNPAPGAVLNPGEHIRVRFAQ
jgi:cell division protein FtsI (penicillin-binding protein 3)